jgi:hypothetical protein
MPSLPHHSSMICKNTLKSSISYLTRWNYCFATGILTNGGFNAISLLHCGPQVAVSWMKTNPGSISDVLHLSHQGALAMPYNRIGVGSHWSFAERLRRHYMEHKNSKVMTLEPKLQLLIKFPKNMLWGFLHTSKSVQTVLSTHPSQSQWLRGIFIFWFPFYGNTGPGKNQNVWFPHHTPYLPDL